MLLNMTEHSLIHTAATFVVLFISVANIKYFLCPGTNVDQAKKLLQESGLAIQSATDLSDAAEKAVASLN